MVSQGYLDQAGHLLLQLEHEHPVLAVLVEGVDDELCEVGAGAVSVDLSCTAHTLTHHGWPWLALPLTSLAPRSFLTRVLHVHFSRPSCSTNTIVIQ